MNKPLKDWTLGEIKDHCKSQGDDCSSCMFWSSDTFCKVEKQTDGMPDKWDLSEPPRWTRQERRMAQAIKMLWPDAEDIRARDSVFGAVEYRVCAGCKVYGVLYDNYFPTMQIGKEYAVDEIIGGAE